MTANVEARGKAELIVADWLEQQGYAVGLTHRNTTMVDLVADGPPGKIAVVVKSGTLPFGATDLSSAEHLSLSVLAQREGRLGYLAQISMDAQGNPTGEIKWRRVV